LRGSDEALLEDYARQAGDYTYQLFVIMVEMTKLKGMARVFNIIAYDQQRLSEIARERDQIEKQLESTT
jgi:hypothetical protein